MDRYLLVLVPVLLVCPASSYAGVVWQEAVYGDLSNSGSYPTSLPLLTSGSNRVLGSVGLIWTGDPSDAATFTVPAGYILSHVILADYDYGVYYDYVPFSLYSGPIVSGSPIESILLTEFGIGTDLLQFDSAPDPQPSGSYTFYFGSIQQDVAVDERSTYEVDLVVALVPEPAALSLLVLGGLALLRRRHARSTPQPP